jgi:hypothetical protein
VAQSLATGIVWKIRRTHPAETGGKNLLAGCLTERGDGSLPQPGQRQVETVISQ